MTAVINVASIVAMILAAAAIARLLFAIESRREQSRHARAAHPPGAGLIDYDQVMLMEPRDRRAMLRHPCWTNRCKCGVYGIPWEGDVTLRDEDTIHGKYLCQPDRERLARPGDLA